MHRTPVVYDLTRLITRFSRLTPNGIDRVDTLYAAHFLSPERQGQGLLFTPLGNRGIDTHAGRAVVEAVSSHWRETQDDGQQLEKLFARMTGSHAAPAAPREHSRGRTARNILRLASGGHGPVLGRAGLFPGRTLAAGTPGGVPQGAVYLNVSQFPVWIDRYFSWMDRRPDVRGVFFLHDTLPLDRPEFFPPAEFQRHENRLRVISRRAAGVIVSSDITARALHDHLGRLGLPVPRICVAALPVMETFAGGQPHASLPAGLPPYFVSVGTLEPRKNHLLLLNLWKELVRIHKDRTPKLILVGSRGWENENVVDLIERCAPLRNCVIECRNLPSPSLQKLLTGARALLMPSHAEGYGLPVVESLASGVTVVASDIEIFGSFHSDRLIHIDVLDGMTWLRAITDLFQTPRSPEPGPSGDVAPSQSWHINHVENFLSTL